MRKGRTISKRYNDEGKKYLPLAHKYLGMLLKKIRRTDKRTARWRRNLQDGTEIEIITINGYNIIRINGVEEEVGGIPDRYMDSGYLSIGRYNTNPVEEYVVDESPLYQNSITRNIYGYYIRDDFNSLHPDETEYVDNGDIPPSYEYPVLDNDEEVVTQGEKAVLWSKTKEYTGIAAPGRQLSGRAKLYMQAKLGLKITDSSFSSLIGSTFLPSKGGTSVYEDSLNNHWVITYGFDDSPFRLICQATKLRSPLFNKYSDLDSDSSRLPVLAHAYAIAQLTDTVVNFEITVPNTFLGTPIAYGWKFNFQGDEGVIVLHDYLGADANYKTRARLFNLQLTSYEQDGEFVFSGEVTQHSEADWKCQGGFIVHYTNEDTGTCIWPGYGEGTPEDFTSVPIYAFYDKEGDNLWLESLRTISGSSIGESGPIYQDSCSSVNLGFYDFQFGIPQWSYIWTTRRTATVSWEYGSALGYTGAWSGSFQSDASSFPVIYDGSVFLNSLKVNDRVATCEGCVPQVTVFPPDDAPGPCCNICGTAIFTDVWGTFEQTINASGTASGGTCIVPPWGNAEALMVLNADLTTTTGGVQRSRNYHKYRLKVEYDLYYCLDPTTALRPRSGSYTDTCYSYIGLYQASDILTPEDKFWQIITANFIGKYANSNSVTEFTYDAGDPLAAAHWFQFDSEDPCKFGGVAEVDQGMHPPMYTNGGSSNDADVFAGWPDEYSEYGMTTIGCA